MNRQAVDRYACAEQETNWPMNLDPQATTQILRALLNPWHDAVDDPAKAQRTVLHRLLEDYARTRHGRQCGASQIDHIDDYRRAFPVTMYEEFRPLLDEVMAGEVDSLLAEEPLGWAMTRGTTKGESKFIPMTPTDLRGRISAGRAMMNFVLSSGRLDLFDGVNLKSQLSFYCWDHAGGRSRGRVRLQLRYLRQARLDFHAYQVSSITTGDRCIRRRQDHASLEQSF